MEKIIDASNCIIGRLASHVSKELIKSHKVIVINTEKAVISGNPKAVEAKFKQKIDRGDPYHGPFYPRQPERIFKRVVRGMLPKNAKGRDALKKLRVYISIPEDMKDRKALRIKGAENNLKCKYTEIGKISKKLGATVRW